MTRRAPAADNARMRRMDLFLPLAGNLDDVLAQATTLGWCARRACVTPADTGLTPWLCRQFGIVRQHDWPLAPVCARADGMDPGEAPWLRLDPLHLEPGLRGLIPHAAASVGLDAEEAVALSESLRPLWAEAGMTLHTPHPTRWYLRLASAPEWHAAPPEMLAHMPLERALPQGAGAREFMRLVNDAQMLLHAHPVNRLREARGAAPINGLWAWGGGRAPWVGTVPDVLAGKARCSDQDALLAAVADYAGTRRVVCPRALTASSAWAGARHALVVLPVPDAPEALETTLARLEGDWLRPLRRAVRMGRLRSASITVPTHPPLRVELDFPSAWGLRRGTTSAP